MSTKWRDKPTDDDEFGERPKKKRRPLEDQDEDVRYRPDPPANSGGGAFPSDEYADLGGDDDTTTW